MIILHLDDWFVTSSAFLASFRPIEASDSQQALRRGLHPAMAASGNEKPGCFLRATVMEIELFEVYEGLMNKLRRSSVCIQ